jgi:hypothetical protein
MSGRKARRNRVNRLQAVGDPVTRREIRDNTDSAVERLHQLCKQITGPMAGTLDELRAAPSFEK